MGLSSEAIIAVLGLLVSLPPTCAVLMRWWRATGELRSNISYDGNLSPK